MPTVSFFNADRKLKYADKNGLKAFIKTLFTSELISLQKLQYIFCSDNYLLEINKQFLQHNYFTDIITFDLSEEDKITGEIYISLDRVNANAKALAISFGDELLRVIFHGALHLCGYKDKKKSEIVKMRNREDHYMRLYAETTLHK